MAHLVTVKPGKLSARQRKTLEANGIVVVELEDPSDLKIVRVEPTEMEASELAWAAIAAIDESNLASVAQKFVSNCRKVIGRKLKQQNEGESK